MASCGIMIDCVRKDGSTDRIPCPGRVIKYNETTRKWGKEEACEHYRESSAPDKHALTLGAPTP
jgi:hypothetical protein